MKKIEYAHVGETLFLEQLPNGLRVLLWPKKDFYKTYALFTTNFGSIDNEFIPVGENEKVHFPDGIAHFLEHKLFEKEDGDVFQKFEKLGSFSNANTGFTRTSYLFSTTSKVEKNLEMLMDFVQEPYFTEELIDKEQGIIAQEMQMYQDEPDWRLFLGLLENLYPNNVLSCDIVGTRKSISKITAEMLYQNFYRFYHPSNMTLVVGGRFDADEIMRVIKENQAKKKFSEISLAQKTFSFKNDEPIIEIRSIKMNIVYPKFILGLKGRDEIPKNGAELLQYRFSLKLYLQMLFGPTSQNFLQLYTKGLVDDSFSYAFTLDRGFHLIEINGDADDPQKVTDFLQEKLKNYQQQNDFNEETFELLKRKMISKFIQSLNSIETVVNQLSCGSFSGEDTVFLETDLLLRDLSFAKFQKFVQQFMDNAVLSCFYIYPKESSE
ncbi:MAG: insulinase family protein [Streptococcaceae bacterium]|jgi:predicted Zn-dependent peptidase|nr:insulinase family protein [Streptococcaceae bacterium]